MGVFETLLLLAGSAIAIAILGLVAYRGFSGRKTVPAGTVPSLAPESNNNTTPATVSMAPSQSSTSSEQASASPEVESTSAPLQTMVETPQVVSAPAEMASIPVSVASVPAQEEAPPPFPEEQNTPKTSIPTDVTAVSNISSPAEGATPVLVISTPKPKAPRASRKRLPTSAAPGAVAPRRRRSSTKAKVSAPQVTVVQPTAATTTPDTSTVPVEHQE